MRELADTSVYGSHLCHLFADPQERRDAVVPFFKTGLAAGECCILSLGNSRPDEIRRWYVEFESAGVDVSSARGAGALIITDDSDSRRYFRDATSVVRVREAWLFLEGILTRFPAIRIASEMDWTAGLSPGAEQLCHWEATFDLLIKETRIQALCLYDLNRLTPPEIHSALRTHPSVRLNDEMYLNSIYEAPEILAHEPNLNGSTANPETVSALLTQLRASPTLKPPGWP